MIEQITRKTATRIAVVTGARSDYGLLYWILRALNETPDFTLQLVASGMHLDSTFGNTINEIREDGFEIAAEVDFLETDNNDRATVARATGRATIAFSNVFEQLRPQVLMVLGDRFEILAATQAAMLINMPIAHIHGGEVTEGALDDAIRHSVTKMASLHFVATETYRNRVIQLGEHPSRVFNVGAPGLESLTREILLTESELAESLGISLGHPLVVVTYHPETAKDLDPGIDFEKLLAALDRFPDLQLIFTAPNTDAGGRELLVRTQKYVEETNYKCKSGRACLVESLGRKRYLSLLKYADAVVGNSSSGIIEAPSFQAPTLNIGLRQKGRVAAASVTNTPCDTDAITHALTQVLSPEFRKSLATVHNPYGNGNTSEKILSHLRKYDWDAGPARGFYDLSGGNG